MKILIAGDFAPRERVEKSINNHEYKDIFASLTPFTKTADYSILNLEAPIVQACKTPIPIPKVGPSLRASCEALDVIKDAGFNCVTLANNHILDYGAQSLLYTIQQLDKKGILHVGAGENLEDAARCCYLEKDGQKVALINFCENEFSIASICSPGANPLCVTNNSRQIQLAKKKADIVIVIIHGGNELYQLPSPRMKDLYHFYIECGADVIINHHQHCYGGVELYNSKPIFYGLGNLCFDSLSHRYSVWNYGYCVLLSTDDSITYDILPYSQCLKDPVVSLLSSSARESFFSDLEALNQIIKDDERLSSSFNSLVEDRRLEMVFRIKGFHGWIMRNLFHFKLLPRRLGRRKALSLINLVDCESQRDILLKALNSYVRE